jgi:hypothetical protein
MLRPASRVPSAAPLSPPQSPSIPSPRAGSASGANSTSHTPSG